MLVSLTFCSSENKTAVKFLMALSNFLKEKANVDYDLRFLGAYPTWIALGVVFVCIGFIYLFTHLLTNSIVTDRNTRYQKAMRWKEDNTL